ncbi:hypothetical protein B1757_13710 [Acidithiobacillus marinus]|uniref:Uncharacterized protein n=1 Tax=Acidithiobacillus marinus TaxID=187490 RepID=A0A2I1DIG4_9PROT|nr:hypothetical protein [Acidithiobacillus marinus]PKY09655.1 hypothetical protein B1757_13710 [Acidithiobacillus marinus]
MPDTHISVEDGFFADKYRRELRDFGLILQPHVSVNGIMDTLEQVLGESLDNETGTGYEQAH